MTFVHLNIDGQELCCTPGQTILAAALQHGISIPNLCYDGKVEPYGACGLCLVEVAGSPKLARACATVVGEGMVISTQSPRVIAERKIALELLLSDHRGDCIAPCQAACPAQADCQGYVGLLAAGHPREALMLLKDSYPLPASLGRVCPHPCETACRRSLKEGPVAIAALKQYAADHDLATDSPFLPAKDPATGKKVAIIGGGPAGLTMAWFLAKAGHEAIIYDMMPQAGGMLRYGIPQYRLPKEILDAEIQLIQQLGVTIIPNTKLGQDISLSFLRQQYDAVYLAIGAWQSTPLGCPGEDLPGVLGGIDFLRQVALHQPPELGERVAIVGGGNTAMDACRTAKRLGAKEVYLIYRRTRAEMPAEEQEIAEAEEEGITFQFLVSPTEVLATNGKACGLRLQEMALGEPDASGRRRPLPIPGATVDLAVDTVIAAIGQRVAATGCDDVTLTKKNTIAVDETTFTTNLPGVFAGGDAINRGPGIAIEAIAHAKYGAQVLNSYLAGNFTPLTTPYRVEKTDVQAADLPEVPEVPRHSLHYAPAALRATNFLPVAEGFTPEEAQAEGSRCLECGCFDVHDCKLLAYAREYQVTPAKVTGENHKRPTVSDHPFIFRDPNKCILCGLCVRTCAQVVGANVIDLTGRGFDTGIQAGFGTSLQEAGCKSCGQCITACPTGALQERQPNTRTIPLPTQPADHICNYCGMGCPTKVHAYGTAPVKVTPTADGRLCRQGRFGWHTAMNPLDLTPMVKGKKASYALAIQAARIGLHSFQPSEVGVLISDSLTNEEIYLASQLSPYCYSANADEGGLADVLGADGSTCAFEDLTATDLILAVNIDPGAHYPMLQPRIKKGLAQGSKLYAISPEPTSLTPLATQNIPCDDTVAFLAELVKALLDTGCTSKKATGLEELATSLAQVHPGLEAQAVAAAYKNAKNAILLFDRSRTTKEASHLLAAMAVLTGHLGRGRNGILQLRQNSNSQGLANLHITKDLAALQQDMAAGAIHALVLVGQFLPREITDSAQFLLVLDSVDSPAAAYADAFLPMAGFGATAGTRTSCQNRIGHLTDVLETPQVPAGYTLLSQLAYGQEFGLGVIQNSLAQDFPLYKGGFTQEKTFATPGGTPIRAQDKFETPDGCAQLQPASPAAPLTKTLHRLELPILNWFRLLAEKGL